VGTTIDTATTIPLFMQKKKERSHEREGAGELGRPIFFIDDNRGLASSVRQIWRVAGYELWPGLHPRRRLLHRAPNRKRRKAAVINRRKQPEVSNTSYRIEDVSRPPVFNSMRPQQCESVRVASGR
jgi:hypothetical protein